MIRFSARTLQVFAATGLPPSLAVRAAANGQPAEILLYDEIGFYGIRAADFAKALTAAGDGPLRVRINSPGGDVFDGLAIYNMLLARTAPVETVVDGLAASAASFIALAGSTVTMAESSFLMVHNAWGIVIGNRNDMRETANTLDKIDGQLAAIYAAKTGKSADDMAAMMNAETWLTSSDAKECGMIDAVLPPADKSAKAQAESKPMLRAGLRAALRNAFDPDGDGDDDAAEAVALIQQAIGTLSDAVESLTGTGPGEDDAAQAAAAEAFTVSLDLTRLRARLAEAY